MKHLMGLLRPDSGEIYVDGEDVVAMYDPGQLGRLRLKFGMAFQYSALFDSITVVENIAFPSSSAPSCTQAEIWGRVRARSARLDLADLRNIEHKYPRQLSRRHAQARRLGTRLVARPEILLYDEPTTGLDPVATRNVDHMIRHISRRLGVTGVVISHDIASTFRIARPDLDAIRRGHHRHRHPRRGACE